MTQELECDVLLFFATTTERQQLKTAAQRMGFVFDSRKHEKLGRYYHLGQIGDFRVNAVQTEMGPLSYKGSASQAIYYKNETGATAIVQLGMAFGTIPSHQRLGDVLVSSSLIPYDRRDIRPEGTGYVIDYSPAERHSAKASLVKLFQEERDRIQRPYRVYVGALLSGSARIHSRYFRDELVSAIPPKDDPIIGGEMEGIGLLSVSPREDPAWIVVKGISDFADEERDKVIKDSRPLACGNSASFVLSALLNARQI